MNINYDLLITPAMKTAEARVAMKQAVAAYRYTQEIKGIELGGLHIDSGRDSQALITGAVLEAMLDPTYVCNWKTPNGFIALDAPTLITIARGLRAHVQACFDREGELLQAVDAGTYTEELLTTGWPGA